MADAETKRFRRYPQLAQLVRETGESDEDWKRRVDRERKRLAKGYGQPLGAPKKRVGGFTHGEPTGLVRQEGESDDDWRQRRMREVMRRRRADPALKAKSDARRRELYAANGDSETRKAWKALNADKIKEYSRLHAKRNLPKRLAALEAWAKANPEKAKAARRAYVEANRHIYTAACARIRARAIQATPAWADWKEIERFYNLARKMTRRTGIEHQVDHIIPLNGKTVCGLHTHHNLRVITKDENQKKHNRLDLSLLEAA